ncbi:hypothetical protein HN958_00635 [Candidatus Falkowbacteria bacterium]|nr:hypothetical protein [Candidatus Falkowbacteria bacterium]MBT7006996.1 hypothetical protein [Candidatus Falkowbacteria bacterium]
MAWLFAVKYNFERINKELGDENQQAVENFIEVEELYNIENIIDEGKQKIEEITSSQETTN